MSNKAAELHNKLNKNRFDILWPHKVDAAKCCAINLQSFGLLWCWPGSVQRLSELSLKNKQTNKKNIMVDDTNICEYQNQNNKLNALEHCGELQML